MLLTGGLLAVGEAWSAAPAASAPANGPVRGPKAYDAICRHCHEAGVGPELRGRQLQPVYIDLFVRRGMRAMPAFPRSFVDDATLAQIAEFIQKSGAPPAAPTGAPAKGGGQ